MNSHDMAPRSEDVFVGLTETNYRAFPRIKSIMEKAATDALTKLYERIGENAEASALLPNQQMREGAAKAQYKHWLDLFSGTFDETARGRSENIGQVHARVGLSPSFYIGGYALVLEEVIRQALGRGLHTRLNGRQLGNVIATLVKTALLDMEAALAAYFAAEEKAREAVITSLGQALAQMAQGDLRAELEDLPPAYALLAKDFHQMRHQVSTIVSQMANAADNIDTGASEISAAADDLATRTEQQAAALARTAEVMQEITRGMHTTAANAKHVDHSVSQANMQARHGGAVVENAVVAMDKIKTSSSEIAKITELIEAIAFQTNLLALNAGVEAARAGDAGKGFAVVASEVRALAHRTTESAKSIKELIAKSGADVEQGVELVGQTGVALQQIIQQVSDATRQAQEISAYADTQAASLEQLSREVDQMDATTQQNAAMVEESNAASRALSEEARMLTQLVGRFKLEQRREARSQDERGDRFRYLHAPSQPQRTAVNQ